jgi:hypothetical protein
MHGRKTKLRKTKSRNLLRDEYPQADAPASGVQICPCVSLQKKSPAGAGLFRSRGRENEEQFFVRDVLAWRQQKSGILRLRQLPVLPLL